MYIDEKFKVILTRKDKIADGILAVIALKGYKCYDDLYLSRPASLGGKIKEREELGSQSTVYYWLKQLERCKLIRVYKKIGDKTLYDLTLPGLLVALSFEPLSNHVDKIVAHHAGKLPLILGKWDFFVDTKVVGIVKERMKEYLSFPPEVVHLSPYHLLIYGLKEKEKEKRESFMRELITDEFEHRLQEDLNRYILFPWVFGIVYDFYVPNVSIPDDDKGRAKIEVTDDMEQWISILLLDSELKSYLISELDHLEKYGDFSSKVAKIFKLFIDKYPFHFYSSKRKVSHTG
jgi:hypothetical protein